MINSCLFYCSQGYSQNMHVGNASRELSLSPLRLSFTILLCGLLKKSQVPEEKQRTKQKHTHTTKFAPRMCGEIALLLSLETRTISRTRFGTFLFDLVQKGESEVSSWMSSPITSLNVHAVYFISCCSFGCKCTIYVITAKDLRYYMYIKCLATSYFSYIYRRRGRFVDYAA